MSAGFAAGQHPGMATEHRCRLEEEGLGLPACTASGCLRLSLQRDHSEAGGRNKKLTLLKLCMRLDLLLSCAPGVDHERSVGAACFTASGSALWPVANQSGDDRQQMHDRFMTTGMKMRCFSTGCVSAFSKCSAFILRDHSNLQQH